MKKILFIILLATISGLASAQIKKDTSTAIKPAVSKTKTTKPPPPPEKPKPVVIVIPTPEYINQPFYYDGSDNRLIRLETTTAQMTTKKKTLGLKGAKQSLIMSDGSSKIRFTAKSNITFIIKTSGDVIDLTSYIKLYKFVPVEEKREVTITSKEGVLNDKDDVKGKLITLNVKMISKDNYMIQFSEALEAGEYGFVWVKNMELKEFSVFAFGVDWRNSD